MPLDLPRYKVFTAPAGVSIDEAVASDSYVEHRVTVFHADQLRAEVTGPRFGLTSLSEQSLAYTTMWTWAALTRQLGADTVGDWPAYKASVISLERLEDETPTPDDDEAGPTRQGVPTGVPSSSPGTTEAAPDTGWNPPDLTP